MSNRRSASAAAVCLYVSACARIQSFFLSLRFPGAFLFALLWLVYLVLPTRNHYWDGIGFALNIEGVAQDHNGLALGTQAEGSHSIYFNPNHLLHNLFGYLIYSPIRAVWPAARALDVLVAVNSFLGALTAWLLFRILNRWSGDAPLSGLVTLLLGFSATWWKFSTDANAYVPSVCLLVWCTWMLTDTSRRPKVFAVGVVHAVAILIHQIAVLFYPAVVLAIWLHPAAANRRQRAAGVLRYSLASAVPVLAAYLSVWFGVYGNPWSLREFVSWLTYNGGDVYAFSGPGGSFVTSAATLVRVFFGGRPALAWRVVPAPWLVLAGLLMSLALWRMLRRRPVPPRAESVRWPAIPFFFTWAIAFQLFLFFWLTEYPYYRLFSLPALLCLVALAARLRPSWRSRLPAFVVFLAVFNFTFMIYPYSRTEATPPVHLAGEASMLWPKDTLVLYQASTCDNWILRYFNPHTRWIHVPAVDRELLSTRIRETLQVGRPVWLDTTLIGHLQANAELREWLDGHGMLRQSWGLSNGRYHIRFARLEPLR